MSNFHQDTINPNTGMLEKAEWLDDYIHNYSNGVLTHYEYGIKFPDGGLYTIDELNELNELFWGIKTTGSIVSSPKQNPESDDFTWDEMFMLKELLNYVFECGDL